MSSVDTQWFRGVLADRKLSQRKLAALMEMDPAALSLTLRGMRHVRLEEAQRMADILKVSVSELLTHFGVRALSPNGGTKSVPVIGTLDQSFAITSVSGDYVTRPADLEGEAVALFNLANQWLYFLQPTARLVDALNRYCMVQVKGETQARMGYVRRGLRGEWMVQANLTTIPEVAEIEHAAPVTLIKPL